MIKSRILQKIQAGKQLSGKEQSFLEKWNKGGLTRVSTPTTLKFSDLSERDSKFFRQFAYSDLTQYPNFSVSEVLFEVSQLLSVGPIKDYELILQQSTLQNEWNLNVQQAFSFQESDTAKYLITLEEDKVNATEDLKGSREKTNEFFFNYLLYLLFSINRKDSVISNVDLGLTIKDLSL